MKTLLAIDYSTQSTGYAVFNVDDKTLIKHGLIKVGNIKAFAGYPFGTLRKLEVMGDSIKALANSLNPEIIVIEEINQGISRMGQKTLCMGHAIMLQKLTLYDGKLFFKSSDGFGGWRTELKHFLTDADKEYNKDIREMNKKVAKPFKKEPLTKKHITCRWVNQKFNKTFDIDNVAGDVDQCDAIGLAYSVLLKMK